MCILCVVPGRVLQLRWQVDWHCFVIITATCTLRCSRESFAATWCWAVTKILAMAATVGDPATTPSPAGAPPACPVPSATPCFDHTALIFTLSFSSVLVDTRTVCQLMDTCSACLSGLWTLAVLVCHHMGIHSPCHVLWTPCHSLCLEFYWACSPGCQILLDNHNSCQSCWVYTVLDITYWTLAFLSSVLADTHSPRHQS